MKINVLHELMRNSEESQDNVHIKPQEVGNHNLLYLFIYWFWAQLSTHVLKFKPKVCSL